MFGNRVGVPAPLRTSGLLQSTETVIQGDQRVANWDNCVAPIVVLLRYGTAPS